MTARSACLAIVLVAAFPAAAPTLHASEIAGRVVLSGTPAADAIVSIEGLTLTGEPDATIRIVDHRNLDFVPHVLVVRPGAKVRFENSDRMPCHIYSISPAGTFALRAGDDPPATIAFDRPGVIVVRCADHSRIYAYIVVRENPFYAVTDGAGRYRLSGVPAGRYTLQAWYEGVVIETRSIEVAGGPVKADFTADRPRPQVQNDAAAAAVSWRKQQ